MAHNCLQNNHVRSDRRNEALGIATYNVEVAPDDAEVLWNLAESTSATTKLHLNSVEFDYRAIPLLQPAWDLVEPQLQFDHLMGFVSIGDTSEHDFEDMFDDLPSLQLVSDSSLEPEEPENVSDNIWSVVSGSMPGLQPHTDSTSSSGGDSPIPVEDDGIWVQELDWNELELPHTHEEGTRPYTLGNIFEQHAAEVLNCYWPYWDRVSIEENCEFFLVHQVSDTMYAVENTASDLKFYVTSEQLENLHMDLPNAFQQKLRLL